MLHPEVYTVDLELHTLQKQMAEIVAAYKKPPLAALPELISSSLQMS